MIYNSITELIGATPLLRLHGIERQYGLSSPLLAKLEMMNPAGSVKDRVALAMIEAAERDGRLKAGGVIIEPTSGNTGIGLAAIAAARGYRAIMVMPETMSVERRKLLAGYGAELVLTDGALGMNGAVAEAERLHRETPGSIIAGQFDNPENPLAHYRTTGCEIWRDTNGSVAALVAGFGTGGTVSGTAAYLKEQSGDIHVIGVEPSDSPLISGGKAGPHAIQGIGANFVPSNLNAEILDEIITVTTEQALEMARAAARLDGVLCGISGGAALWAAVQAARRAEFADKNVVAVLPDSGERYLSTALFEE